MHDNLLKLYMDKQKATLTIGRHGIVKFLQEKLKKIDTMEPDSTFGLDYNYQEWVIALYI